MAKSAGTLETETTTRLRGVLGKLSRRLRPTPTATAAGLTPTRTSVLLAIGRSGPVRLSELAASEGLNPTMLSRVVSDFVEVGLVERSSDESDRRAAWVQQTVAGRKLVERIRRERTDALNAALAAMSKQDRQRIEQTLPALEKLAEELKGRRP